MGLFSKVFKSEEQKPTSNLEPESERKKPEEEKSTYADTKTIITEMLKTAVFHLKKNYDLEYGEGSAERLLNDYGPVLLSHIIPGDVDPAFKRLLSDMAKTAVGDNFFGYEVGFVIIPIKPSNDFDLLEMDEPIHDVGTQTDHGTGI